jgi:hypothetical protein
LAPEIQEVCFDFRGRILAHFTPMAPTASLSLRQRVSRYILGLPRDSKSVRSHRGALRAEESFGCNHQVERAPWPTWSRWRFGYA